MGKYQPHEHYQQAMFLGDGLAHAESLIKDSRPNNPYLIKEGPCSNSDVFKGFECRWNEIPSPMDENISLLVMAISPDPLTQKHTYNEVLSHVMHIYGDDLSHHPLTPEQLTLTGSVNLLNIEASIRSAFAPKLERFKYILKLMVMRFVGIFLMNKKIQTQSTNWGKYKHNMIMNTDYRKFDELLRMVISGTKNQRLRLRKELQTLADKGQIAFGIHASASSLITCVVTDYNHNHVHYLDGANGGYAMAAKEMKKQLNNAS